MRSSIKIWTVSLTVSQSEKKWYCDCINNSCEMKHAGVMYCGYSSGEKLSTVALIY